jgi:hypothetical protein
MQGYAWAKTSTGELLIVLFVDGQGYVPAVENAIDLSQIEFLGPVQWPTVVTAPPPTAGPPPVPPRRASIASRR